MSRATRAPVIAPHAIFEGTVWHRRSAPSHEFTQGITMALVDLDRLDDAARVSRLLSVDGHAPAQIRRSDFLGDASIPLAESVRRLVEAELGFRPDGRVLLCASLRTWGWCFNPLATYWCFDGTGDLVAQVLDVTNTPWHEHHAYVIDRRGREHDAVRFAKEHHVSPFFEMDLTYELEGEVPGQRLDLGLTLFDDEGDEVFAAGIRGVRRPFDAAGIRRALTRRPTQLVSAGIYVQAARLWRKGATFVAHPAKAAGRERRASGAGAR
jgi:DUF1365 family protein